MLQRSNRLTQTLFLCGLASTATITTASAADVTGDWRVKDGTAIIRVADCGGTVWGAVIWEQIPGGQDTHNPDVAKKNRPFLGMPLLLNMKPGDDAGEWEGLVYNAKNGKKYDSKIRLSNPDALKIEGCVLGFLCGGETWTRVAALPGAPSSDIASQTKATQTKAPVKPKAKTATTKGAGKTTGSTTPATTTTEGDPVGDVCLLPDVARTAH